MTACGEGCKRGGISRGSLHAEIVADTEAEKEEENGAKDGLNGGEDFEPSERSINCQTEIPAEAEDIQRIRGAEAQGFPTGARIEIPKGSRADSRDHKKCAERPEVAAAVTLEKPVKPDRPASPPEQHAARLQFEGEEIEFIFVLFQPVHFELKTSVSVDERSSLTLALGKGWPFDAAPDRALMKLSAEEFGRLSIEYRAIERSRVFHFRVDEAA